MVAERQILLFGLLTATLPENRQKCQLRPVKTGVHFTVDRAGFFWLFRQSAIIHNGQFAINFAPVLNRHGPLFRGFECGQIKRLQKSGIADTMSSLMSLATYALGKWVPMFLKTLPALLAEYAKTGTF